MNRPCNENQNTGQGPESLIGQEKSILSPELIRLLTENPDIMKKMFEEKNEGEAETRLLLKKHHKIECCCPELLKFKIFLSNVWIHNHNSACPFANAVQ
jgi:hypothetical protein